MSAEEIKDKIEIAKEIVKDQTEPYKTEAFKIILSSLINGGSINSKTKDKTKDKSTKKSKSKQSMLEQKNEVFELSKKCNISTDELSEVITIKNDYIHITKRQKIKEVQKHLLFSACILASYKILYEMEWLPADLLKKCLDRSGVGDLDHFSKALANSSFILLRGERRGKKYKITGKGLDYACDIIKKLSRDESIIEN